jgi:3-oxoacyl-[acyl-carrier-protein] synthase-3
MESRLGMVAGKPSRARRTVLRGNGIVNRHYAIDPATGLTAMSNAQIAAAAVEALGDLTEVDCLVAGTTLPDAGVTNHAAAVHDQLQWPRLSVTSCAGICLAGTAALKHAWLSVRGGISHRAVAVASEMVSRYLLAENFEAEVEEKVRALETRPEIAFEKDFLRWMLSDGAGAVLLETKPNGPRPLRVEWIDISSAAHELPTCMYAGAEKLPDHSLVSWKKMLPEEWDAKSIFTIKQDVRLLNENIARATLREPLSEIMQRRGIRADDVDWFLPHLSSQHFVQQMVDSLKVIGMPIPQDRWFTNLAYKGNTGSASAFIILDEMVRSGRIEKGQGVLMFVPESGRFSSGFVFMRAV